MIEKLEKAIEILTNLKKAEETKGCLNEMRKQRMSNQPSVGLCVGD